MKSLFYNLNLSQKIFFFLFIINQPLFFLYKNLWWGQNKSFVATSLDARNSTRMQVYEVGKEYSTENVITNEELTLWISISIILLFAIYLFKTRKEQLKQ